MRSSFNTFSQGLDDLLEYLEGIELSLKIAANESWGTCNEECLTLITAYKEKIGRGIKKRQFDYNTLVVSLYGFLEQYVESLIKGYVVAISETFSKFDDMPEVLQKNHAILTLDLLGKIDQSKYKGEVSVEALIANLHSCLSGAENFQLNANSFAVHTANYRTDIIDSSFQKIGIDNVCMRAKSVPPFSDYLQATYPERDLNDLGRNEVFFYLDDLSERRNEASHGTASNILTLEIIQDYIAYIKAFGDSLLSVVLGGYYSFAAERNGFLLGKPIAVHNNAIVCFSLMDIKICVGDIIIAKTGNSTFPYLGGEVQEIQIDHESLDEVEIGGQSTDVAVRVLFKAKNNYEYFIVSEFSEQL